MSAKEVSKEANKEKIKALEMAISQIEKNFGKGSIMRLGKGLLPKASSRYPPVRSPST